MIIVIEKCIRNMRNYALLFEMLFPNMEKNKITSLYKKLNKKAYDHIFQTEKGFHSYNLPADLYYRDGVGIYPYFAYGERVFVCVLFL